ncbi:hypothetical protein RQP46_003512 [Phenoliferia psychrophenolica]
MLTLSLLLAAVVAPSLASHAVTIKNNCNSAQPIWVDSANGGQNPGSAQYTGYQPGTLGAHTSQTVTIPDRWNSRICGNSDGARCGDGVSTTSFAEFNMNGDSNDYYDISNIRGFSTGLRIAPHNTSPYGGCQTVVCRSPDCPCDQAFPYGQQNPSCNPRYACPAGDFTVTVSTPYPPQSS